MLIIKEPPMVRAALCIYAGVLLLHSHRCHPNHKLILNNKDCKKDDNNKGEIEDWIHMGCRFRSIIGLFGNKSRDSLPIRSSLQFRPHNGDCLGDDTSLHPVIGVVEICNGIARVHEFI